MLTLLKIAMALMVITSAPLSIAQGRAPQTPDSFPPRAFPRVVAKVGSSVVMVTANFSYIIKVPSPQTGQPDKEIPASWTSGGSGFVIDSDWHIATADHVVSTKKNGTSASSQLPKGQIMKAGSFHLDGVVVKALKPNTDVPHHLMNYGFASAYDAKVYKQDDNEDIAILTVPFLQPMFDSQCRVYHACDGLVTFVDSTRGADAETKLRIAELQLDPPQVGEQVSVIGFPGFQGIGQPPGLFTDSGIVSNAYLLLSGVKVYVASLKVNHGDSGAPLFNDADGKVIGLVDAFLVPQEGGNSGETIVIPIKAVEDLLNSN